MALAIGDPATKLIDEAVGSDPAADQTWMKPMLSPSTAVTLATTPVVPGSTTLEGRVMVRVVFATSRPSPLRES